MPNISELIKTLPPETVYTGRWVNEKGFRFSSACDGLVGMRFNGIPIIKSSGRFFTLENGRVIKRQGISVQYQETFSTKEILQKNNISYKFEQGDLANDVSHRYYINDIEYWSGL